MAISLVFPLPQLVPDLLVGKHLVGAIDPLRDGLDFLEERRVIGVDRREIAHVGIGDLGDAHCQFARALATKLPVPRDDRLAALLDDIGLERIDFSVGIAGEMIHRDHNRHAEGFQILDMPSQIGAASLHRGDILGAEIGPRHPAIHLHRAHRGDKDNDARRDAGLAAFDVHEFLGSEIGPEAGLGHHIIRQFQGRLRRNHRVAAMRDVGERAAMDKGRVVFQRLHQIRLQRLRQQHRHRAIGLDVAAKDWRAVAPVGDDDVAKSFLQILKVGCQAQDGHDFGSDGDVKARLPRKSVRYAAKAGHDIAERAVIHVDDAAPSHAALVDFQLIAPVDMVVDHRRQQIVRRGDGVEVAGEMKVHLLHRHDLRIAATGGTALHAETGAERCLTDADGGLLADRIQPVDKTNGRRCLAFASRGRVDRRHKDQLAIGPALLRRDELGRQFCLVMAEGEQVLRRDAKLVADLLDRQFGGGAGDFDVRLGAHDDGSSGSWTGTMTAGLPVNAPWQCAGVATKRRRSVPAGDVSRHCAGPLGHEKLRCGRQDDPL